MHQRFGGRVRAPWHLGLVAPIALAGCIGGGSGNGGGANNEDGDYSGAPLQWYVALDPVTQLNTGSLAAPNTVLSLDPDARVTETFTSVDQAPVEIAGFARLDEDTFQFSLTTHATIGGVAAAPGDVLLNDGGTISIVYGASAIGLPDEVGIDAVARDEDGNLLLSINGHVNIGGDVMRPADILRFNGSDLTVFISANDLGLDDAADVNALTYRGDGSVVLSLTGKGRAVGGAMGDIAYGHADLLLASTADGIVSVELAASTMLDTQSDVVALSDNRTP